MVRHVFVVSLFLVCAVYATYAFPEIKLEELKRWAKEQKLLDRVERGVGRGGGFRGGHWGRRGPHRRPPPPPPPPPRIRPGWHRPPPHWGWRHHGDSSESSESFETDDQGTAADQAAPDAKTTTTTTRTTTTSTPSTTTTTTTTTANPLVVQPVDDNNVITGDSNGALTGCIVSNVVVAPDKIKCDQVQIGSLQLGFQSFAHTQCGLYCQCSFNGVVINECPQGQAWDQAGNACTTAAKANC